MSMFGVSCLNCDGGESYWSVHPSEWVCPKCKSVHVNIGDVWGLHVCHSFPIWWLKDSDKFSSGELLVNISPGSKSNVEVVIFPKYKFLIEKLEKQIGMEVRTKKKFKFNLVEILIDFIFLPVHLFFYVKDFITDFLEKREGVKR